MASAATISASPRRRLLVASIPAQSRIVWKIRRVLTGDSLTPAANARSDQDQRNVHRRLIKQIAVLLFAVLTETFTVISD